MVLYLRCERWATPLFDNGLRAVQGCAVSYGTILHGTECFAQDVLVCFLLMYMTFVCVMLVACLSLYVHPTCFTAVKCNASSTKAKRMQVN